MTVKGYLIAALLLNSLSVIEKQPAQILQEQTDSQSASVVRVLGDSSFVLRRDAQPVQNLTELPRKAITPSLTIGMPGLIPDEGSSK